MVRILFIYFFLLIIKQNFCLTRAAAMTIRTVLLSLQALLATPEPDDPQDAGNKIEKLF
jgi:ubiquitin-protein ligase